MGCLNPKLWSPVMTEWIHRGSKKGGLQRMRLCSWDSEDFVVKRRVVGISLIYLTIIYWEASFWSKVSWVLELLLVFSREAFQSCHFPLVQKAFWGAGDQLPPSALCSQAAKLVLLRGSLTFTASVSSHFCVLLMKCWLHGWELLTLLAICFLPGFFTQETIPSEVCR